MFFRSVYIFENTQKVIDHQKMPYWPFLAVNNGFFVFSQLRASNVFKAKIKCLMFQKLKQNMKKNCIRFLFQNSKMPFGGAQLSTNFFVLIFFPVLAFKTTDTQQTQNVIQYFLKRTKKLLITSKMSFLTVYNFFRASKIPTKHFWVFVFKAESTLKQR